MGKWRKRRRERREGGDSEREAERVISSGSLGEREEGKVCLRPVGRSAD